jgi:hypothetical protein
MSDAPRCANCGSTCGAIERDGQRVCADCDWPVGMPLPPKPLCPLCGRRHGREIMH